MPRPLKRRRICQLPAVEEFVPRGHECAEAVEMTVDEYETIRLIDHLGFSQEDCARQMSVARTTVQAIYDSARQKVADALVLGKRLCISGGTYDLCPQAQACCGKSCRRRGHSDGCGSENSPQCPRCAPDKKCY